MGAPTSASFDIDPWNIHYSGQPDLHTTTPDPEPITPVDGHHPSSREWKIYPTIGRKLTTADVGQSVLRVCPQLNGKCYDWSHIPCSNTEKDIARAAKKLKSLSEDFFEITFNSGYTSEKPIKDNDGHWLTVQEFTDYISKQA